MSECIPCAWKKNIEIRKQQMLISTAKKRAIENKKYFVVYYDEEDQKHMVTSKENAEKEGYPIVHIVSPY